MGGLQLWVDSRLSRGLFGALARLQSQPRPPGRRLPTQLWPRGSLEPQLFEPMRSRPKPKG
eukprot:15467355-Alexandrium_andersonii.AAC.1